MLLGRESLNRRQYSLQKASVRRQLPRAGSGAGAVDSGPAVGPGRPDMRVEAAVGSGQGAAGAAGAVGAGAAAEAGGVGLSQEQLSEVQLLLGCLRQRTVYIMGRVQLVSAQGEGGAGAPKGMKGLGPAAGAYCRSVVTGAYRMLANNTHPSSASWQLPDDQLVLVSMVVRV